MSRTTWTSCEARWPVPLGRITPDSDDPEYFMSRHVLLYFPNGACAVGWLELLGPWEARADEGDYIGHEGAVARWATEMGSSFFDEPTHWQDLPSPPNVTGLAIMARSLRAGAD